MDSGNGGEPVTSSQMWNVILITRQQQRFEKCFHCSRCGKRWREKNLHPPVVRWVLLFILQSGRMEYREGYYG